MSADFSGQVDGGGIRVDHGGLDTASIDMANTVNQIDATLDNLVRDLAPLVGQWDGETKLAYEECKRTWDTAMTDMKTILFRASGTLSESNNEFRSTDQRNAAQFDF